MLRVFWPQERVFFHDRMTVILMSFVFTTNRHRLPVGNVRMCYQSIAIVWSSGIAILCFFLSHVVVLESLKSVGQGKGLNI